MCPLGWTPSCFTLASATANLLPPAGGTLAGRWALSTLSCPGALRSGHVPFPVPASAPHFSGGQCDRGGVELEESQGRFQLWLHCHCSGSAAVCLGLGPRDCASAHAPHVDARDACPQVMAPSREPAAQLDAREPPRGRPGSLRTLGDRHVTHSRHSVSADTRSENSVSHGIRWSTQPGFKHGCRVPVPRAPAAWRRRR